MNRKIHGTACIGIRDLIMHARVPLIGMGLRDECLCEHMDLVELMIQKGATNLSEEYPSKQHKYTLGSLYGK
jgi:hypothetical protein